MSTRAIWNLNARRNELGKARKWQIYLSKVAIGLVVAAVLWLPLLGDIHAVVIATVAVFVTSKACYYLNTGAWPDGFDAIADWVCDLALHIAWLGLWQGLSGDYRTGAYLVGAWLCSYPWSCE